MDLPPERHDNTVTAHRRILCSSTSRTFHARAGRVTGRIQMCCGVVALLINCAQLFFQSTIGTVAFGFWGSMVILFEYMNKGYLNLKTLWRLDLQQYGGDKNQTV